jgi:hypothetical protein
MASTAAAALARAVAGSSQRFRSLLADPAAVQREQLAQIVDRNRQSRFGLAHGFEAIRDEAGYAQRVSLSSPEQLAPWIASAAAGQTSVLTEEPVVALEETGGSTAGPRLIPYTASGLAGFQVGLQAWLDDLFCARPTLASGRFYWSISPACRAPKVTAAGMPIGLPSDAAYFGAELAPHILGSLAVPPSLAACTAIDDWRRQTLLHLLASADLVMISVWSPSFLTELLASLRDNADAIVDALARSTLASPARCALIAAELAQDQPDYRRIWPRLAVISCWDQASARPHAAQLRADFPTAWVQGKGLLATECLVTLPLHDQPYPLLALQSGYFEFRDAAGRMHGADQVEDGGEYELILSNASGLYRYAIGDIVTVRGFAQRTPMLEFIGRSGGTDLSGEKLSDAFVTQVLARQGLRFAALAVDSAAMRYVLLVDAAEVGDSQAEDIAAQVDLALQRNPQYAFSRRLNQLVAVSASRCAEPISRWIDLRAQAGQRLGDIKLPALIADESARRHLQGFPK